MIAKFKRLTERQSKPAQNKALPGLLRASASISHNEEREIGYRLSLFLWCT